jgi:hypothetical protein
MWHTFLASGSEWHTSVSNLGDAGCRAQDSAVRHRSDSLVCHLLEVDQDSRTSEHFVHNLNIGTPSHATLHVKSIQAIRHCG